METFLKLLPVVKVPHRGLRNERLVAAVEMTE